MEKHRRKPVFKRINLQVTEDLKERLEDLAEARAISVPKLIKEILYKAVLYREKQEDKYKTAFERDKDAQAEKFEREFRKKHGIDSDE